ncbi:hypothetical protein ACTJNK_29830 [Achromobacter anxifer]
MTDQNKVAQAAMQETVRNAIRKAYDDGYNDAKMAPDNCSTYCVQRAEREGTAALLSKLRDSVAGEAQPVADAWWAGIIWHPGADIPERPIPLYAAPQASEAVQLMRKVREDGYLSDTMNHRIAVFFACQPQASEANAAALSTAVDYRRMEDTQVGASERLATLAAALGNRDWKW